MAILGIFSRISSPSGLARPDMDQSSAGLLHELLHGLMAIWSNSTFRDSACLQYRVVHNREACAVLHASYNSEASRPKWTEGTRSRLQLLASELPRRCWNRQVWPVNTPNKP